MKKIIVTLFIICSSNILSSQETFTRKDTLQGGLRPERTCFNVLHYDLNIKPVTGRTMIWPAEWTHAHQGQIITKGSKYIITGWLNIPL